MIIPYIVLIWVFQSTLPAREATKPFQCSCPSIPYFNPRFPRGKRHKVSTISENYVKISIHASREGSDRRRVVFIQTPPISIHASREGSDDPVPGMDTGGAISIHASREGSDQINTQGFIQIRKFQSTLPAREAT